ncbi:hypothetical protein WDV93_07635 [Pantoea ananatis]
MGKNDLSVVSETGNGALTAQLKVINRTYAQDEAAHEKRKSHSRREKLGNTIESEG